ncbi:ECF-type sigma factor [Aliiglaciecola sp. M165]|uniref:ECF-type sigma factor n=1 Tax=Aliiglaciecola sp. M165 TaxID=2593649 RepID=UPI0011814298|nr:ECF-type sigma factor [Aliiglaciecola sp. M165]TRY32514.1 sigma-70 family RNA polymerase sigma factor [Aliiglaciecola sp. M165]
MTDSACETLNYQVDTEQDKLLANELVKDAYHSLLNVARVHRRRARFNDTMMTDDVLNTAFLKITGQTVWQSQQHFSRLMCLAIRQVVVDHARQRLAKKRGGSQDNQEYKEGETLLPEYKESPEEIVMLNELLEQLEQKQPRLSLIVNARYFASLTEAETATALGMSERTVRRDWVTARAWLAKKMA